MVQAAFREVCMLHLPPQAIKRTDGACSGTYFPRTTLHSLPREKVCIPHLFLKKIKRTNKARSGMCCSQSTPHTVCLQERERAIRVHSTLPSSGLPRASRFGLEKTFTRHETTRTDHSIRPPPIHPAMHPPINPLRNSPQT